MIDRELLITLTFSGGSADLAYLLNNKYNIDQYTAAIITDEFKQFAAQLNDEFIANADLRLIGQLYRCESALLEIGPDHKNYTGILRNYTELLKLTGPIIERLSKHAIETNTFQGLELRIKGVE